MITEKSLLSAAWQTPWKVTNELFLIWLYPWSRLLAWVNRLQWQTGWKWYGLPQLQLHRGSQVSIGRGLQLRSTKASNPLSPTHPVMLSTRSQAASLQIGDNFSMTGGAIVAAETVKIGDRVMVGANSYIMDTDFHPLEALVRQQQPLAGKTAPVKIGSDVFIGTQVLILKGTNIGDRTVVGAGSVVSGNIPSDVVVAGNPARVIKKLTALKKEKQTL